MAQTGAWEKKKKGKKEKKFPLPVARGLLHTALILGGSRVHFYENTT